MLPQAVHTEEGVASASPATVSGIQQVSAVYRSRQSVNGCCQAHGQVEARLIINVCFK